MEQARIGRSRRGDFIRERNRGRKEDQLKD